MSKRYFLVKVISSRGLSSEQFTSALVNSVRKYFGEFGLARINPRIVRFDANKSEGVVGCRREGAEDLQAAIGLIPDTPEMAITAITIRVSGTIKGLKGRQRF